MSEKKNDKPVRKLVDFIKSEEGGIKPDKVIKIGGLTFGLLSGMFGSDLFASRSHTNSVDLTFNPTAPGQVGTHVNNVSWAWGWGNWASWSNCSCA